MCARIWLREVDLATAQRIYFREGQSFHSTHATQSEHTKGQGSAEQ
jgi:hypothetical protein